MGTQFTWIAFYKELSQKLLQFKNNRKQLIDFIQSGDKAFINDAGKSLVEYLHMRDGSPISDIDPFSVFAIFNRGRITYKNRQNICAAFKDFLGINAAIPDDFDGIPIVDPRRSFFFTWDINRNPYIIADMWELYERVVSDNEIEEWYDKVLSNKFPKNSLTMVLYWLNPIKYMALDSRSRSFLQAYGITHFNIGSYKEYATILNIIKKKMINKELPYTTFAEISYAAWLSSNTNLSNPNNMNINPLHPEIISLLQANKNLILTGAPGTGKTFMAKEIAKAMNAEWEMVQFHPSYDYTDFVEGIRPSKDKHFEYTAGIFKQFCAKALNNFQESQKSKELIAKEKDTKERIFSFLATAKTENKKFVIKNGAEYYIGDYDDHTITFYNEKNPISKEVVAYIEEIAKLLNSGHTFTKVKEVAEFLNRNHGYQKDSYIFSLYEELNKWSVDDVTVGEIVEKRDYVFIIDEINRGELSKIFGELFGAIEKGYRGECGRVRTQYQNMIPEDDPFKDGFFVPENVYIIGTMNDIDRSVESMDFAMRRRFAWKEVTAAESYETIIANNGNFKGNKAEVEQRMSRLNAEIENRLGRAYQIGAAYFINLQDDDFEALWKNHLEGLLFEYFRGERDAQQKVDELHKIYNGE